MDQGAPAIPAMLIVRSIELAVPSTHIPAKHGLVNGYTAEMLHERIEGLSVEQGIAGRLLDYDALPIHGTGGGQEAIANIARPLQFRNAVLRAVGDLKR